MILTASDRWIAWKKVKMKVRVKHKYFSRVDQNCSWLTLLTGPKYVNSIMSHSHNLLCRWRCDQTIYFCSIWQVKTRQGQVLCCNDCQHGHFAAEWSTQIFLRKTKYGLTRTKQEMICPYWLSRCFVSRVWVICYRLNPYQLLGFHFKMHGRQNRQISFFFALFDLARHWTQ